MTARIAQVHANGKGWKMCWSASASVAFVAIGGAATAVTYMRGEPKAIWVTLGFFTLMEGLQAAGYAVADQCTDPANRTLTWASYLHIAIQPIFVNAFAMAIAPRPVSPGTQKVVYSIVVLCSVILLFQTVPLEALGPCRPGTALCGVATCLFSGEWHIGWHLPMNGLFNEVLRVSKMAYPSYFVAVFLIPVFYGAWRLALFHLLAGPVAASFLTSNPSEMPAIWCLFSIGIALIALSPPIRYGVMRAPRPA